MSVSPTQRSETKVPGRSARQPRRRSRQTRAALGAFTAVIALLLLIAHVLKPAKFAVDAPSLGLLGFVSLPFLSLVVTSFKAGGVEFAFRDLSVHEQVLTFLDGVALKKQWTFFRPRSREGDWSGIRRTDWRVGQER